MAAFMEKKRPSEEEDEDSVTAAVAEEDAKGWSDRRWRGRGGCGGGVTLEGFVLGAAGNGEGGKTRRSLTDEDLEELKGCLDLGFGFSYEEIPELRNTLPALELCYSMSQMLRLDDPNQQMSSENSPLLAHWRISSPADMSKSMKRSFAILFILQLVIFFAFSFVDATRLKDGRCDELYIVEEGETLQTISVKCDNIFILDDNPHIGDTDDIGPGTVLFIRQA
ncbi:hypothetical protein ZIOFF_031058 [Zingiber officinale]|uniref:LysM domain-containing protein n=1 Tax=Zingiber officinale TaxID=94328 RepID=A0A8J5H0N8_ZINOF|nr:hypothetical protein ZIOFF_031058 [Zingiber officinale]